MNPLPADQALDRYFLDVRCRLLEVAATLDRIGRGKDHVRVAADPRVQRILQAINVLGESKTGRAERIQQIFSLEYEPAWERPKPR